jgi:DNA-binding protein Fis
LPDKGVNLYELEASLIKLALARTKGNSRQASVLLGLSVEALKYRRKKLED